MDGRDFRCGDQVCRVGLLAARSGRREVRSHRQNPAAAAAASQRLLQRHPAGNVQRIEPDGRGLGRSGLRVQLHFLEAASGYGQDPCSTPGAICQTRDYAGILKAEVDGALRHILSYRQWSFFFHQSNLKNYGAGKTLQYDWLNAVVGEYDKTFKLPLKSPAFFEIGADTANRVKARQATLDGYASLDASANPVTVTIRVASGGPVTIPMTGISKPTGNAALYGGQSVQSVTLTDALQTFTVNRAM